MRKLLRIFALLMAASMLVWLAGCGDDDDDDEEAVPVVQSVMAAGSALAGATVPANASIVVTFDIVVTAATVTVDATGTTAVSGKTATWTPTGNMSEGGHALTAIEANGQTVAVPGGTISFTVTVPDTEAPTLDGGNCDPEDGEDGVDPADYPEKISAAISDNVAVTDAKVTSTDPDFPYIDDFADGQLTLTFQKYSMPNETEYTIEIEATDGTNKANLTWTFTTMAKE
jgi:hypothetical protein